jgi:hypothetical protein
MTNLFRDIRIKCAAAGTNLTAVCRVAGVHRSVPERWKKGEPRTRRVVEKIYAAIDRIASGNYEKIELK